VLHLNIKTCSELLSVLFSKCFRFLFLCVLFIAVLVMLRKQEKVLPVESWHRGSDIPSLGNHLVDQEWVRLVGDFSWSDSVVLRVPFYYCDTLVWTT